MNIQIIAVTTAAIVTTISGIFGGGMFRAYLKSREEAAVQAHVTKETQDKLEKAVNDIRQLEFQSIENKTKLNQIEESIKKLDLLPDLSARIASMDKLVTNIAEMVANFTRRD